MKILVTGKNGQVARSLSNLDSDTVKIIALGRPEFDITDRISVERVLDTVKPDLVINAAAYTAVDKAEEEPAAAFAVNRDGAKHVAETAANRGLPIIHISTDYVFNGRKAAPYVETDPVGPISIYGLSKLQGEWAVAAANPDHVILRTAWVYSPYGSNFVKTMLRLAETHDEISVVADQWGTPTSADFIAASILSIAQQISSPNPPQNWRGIFHLVPNGKTSWAEFAETIFFNAKALNIRSAQIRHIASSAYKTKAQRPDYSTLDNEKIQKIFSLSMKDWQSFLNISNITD